MKAKIYINRHKVNKIKKGAPEEPVIAIKTYKGVEYAKRASITGEIIQDFQNPICSGATIWIETDRNNITIRE